MSIYVRFLLAHKISRRSLVHASTSVCDARHVLVVAFIVHYRLDTQVLREERVLRKVDIGEYPLDLVPLEKDVLSLELDGLFARVRQCQQPSKAIALLSYAELSLCLCVRVDMCVRVYVCVLRLSITMDSLTTTPRMPVEFEQALLFVGSALF